MLRYIALGVIVVLAILVMISIYNEDYSNNNTGDPTPQLKNIPETAPPISKSEFWGNDDVDRCHALSANEEIWERNENINYNNCYSYAFTDMDSNRRSKPQPGFKVGLPPLPKENYTCEQFVKRVLLDHPEAKFLGNEPELSYHWCGCDERNNPRHLVFLALDNSADKRDFHFYRKNQNGYWTHKPGSYEVLHTDASGRLITNPYLANRSYEPFQYETPCGFFCAPTINVGTLP
jgi:hypothetical protein